MTFPVLSGYFFSYLNLTLFSLRLYCEELPVPIEVFEGLRSLFPWWREKYNFEGGGRQVGDQGHPEP